MPPPFSTEDNRVSRLQQLHNIAALCNISNVLIPVSVTEQTFDAFVWDLCLVKNT